MLKKVILVFVFCQTIFLGYGQDKKWQHQLGFDGINFVRNFVNFSGNSGSIANSPYSLQFKALRHESGNAAKLSGFRVGFGGRITNNDLVSPTNITTTKNSLFDIRLGLEFQRPIAGKFTMLYGVDFIIADASVKNVSASAGGSVSVSTTVSNKTRTYGGGPFWGLQYNINKRFCVGTELSYYFRSALTNNSTSGTTLNDLRTHNVGLSLSLPNVLYFNLLF